MVQDGGGRRALSVAVALGAEGCQSAIHREEYGGKKNRTEDKLPDKT